MHDDFTWSSHVLRQHYYDLHFPDAEADWDTSDKWPKVQEVDPGVELGLYAFQVLVLASR